jgi:hypothetical protein
MHATCYAATPNHPRPPPPQLPPTQLPPPHSFRHNALIAHSEDRARARALAHTRRRAHAFGSKSARTCVCTSPSGILNLSGSWKRSCCQTRANRRQGLAARGRAGNRKHSAAAFPARHACPPCLRARRRGHTCQQAALRLQVSGCSRKGACSSPRSDDRSARLRAPLLADILRVVATEEMRVSVRALARAYALLHPGRQLAARGARAAGAGAGPER